MSFDDRLPGSSRLPRLIAVVLAAVFGAVLIRTAWIGDDMLISLRVVLNVTHGFGLTFNIAERVQAFTHPLWLFIVTGAYLASGNLYLSTLAVSGACSVVVFWLVVTRALTVWQAVGAALVLLSSNAFVDYSTSGLENPLAHVLVVALAATGLRARHDLGRALGSFALLTSLLYLTRPDLALVGLPFLVAASLQVRSPRRIASALVVGTLPASLWTMFSIVYYGFPFPNTAYAKLGAGVSDAARWLQGLLYLADSIDRDPLTLVVIAFGVIVAVVSRHGTARLLSAGIVLYLVYIVSIGGDFMAGRFLSVPLLASVIIVAWCGTASREVWMGVAAVFAGVGFMAQHVPLLSDGRFDDPGVRRNGITNERGVFYRDRSLVRGDRTTFRTPDWPTNTGAFIAPDVAQICGLAGITGITDGPYVHVIDECALSDPLLARMPAVFRDDWRIGHFRRTMPEGYEESIAGNANVLGDEKLRQFYDQIRLITRGRRLFTTERLRAIVAMNLGRFDHLIDRTYYRHERQVATLESLQDVKELGTPLDAPGLRPIGEQLGVTCQDKPGRRYFEVSLDADDTYRLTFLKGALNLGWVDVAPPPEFRRPKGLTVHFGDVPPLAVRDGFDVIVIEPISGNGSHLLGHLLVEGSPATDAILRARRVQMNEHVE